MSTFITNLNIYNFKLNDTFNGILKSSKGLLFCSINTLHLFILRNGKRGQPRLHYKTIDIKTGILPDQIQLIQPCLPIDKLPDIEKVAYFYLCYLKFNIFSNYSNNGYPYDKIITEFPKICKGYKNLNILFLEINQFNLKNNTKLLELSKDFKVLCNKSIKELRKLECLLRRGAKLANKDLANHVEFI